MGRRSCAVDVATPPRGHQYAGFFIDHICQRRVGLVRSFRAGETCRRRCGTGNDLVGVHCAYSERGFLTDLISLRTLEDNTFLLLIVAVSLAFAWILWPLYGAILWGTVIAILFAPLYRRLSKSMRQRRTLAALATVTIIVVMVILPVTLIATLLLQEASVVYDMIRTGELNFGQYFRQVVGALPAWAVNLLA